MRDVRVFYVKEGFASLDRGIIHALQKLVREVVPLHEADDAAGLALRHRPDLVLVLNGTRFPVSQADALRAQGIRVALWLVDDPYHTDLSSVTAPHYDIVFTHELGCVEFYRQLGCPQVHYMPLAAGPETYFPRRVDAEYRTDICFIGNAFRNRLAFIDEIAPFLADKKVLIAGWWWDRLSRFELLRDKIRLNTDWLSPEETCSYYNGAKIVVNLHRADDDPSNFNSRGIAGVSVNPRTYEIGACGSFQLSDLRGDTASLYRPGVEIATYSSPAEFISIAAYYLEHEREREGIALRGLRRTLEEHTYAKRLDSLLEVALA
nr:glycosyltransferase [Paenibacillus hamazuiensis]